MSQYFKFINPERKEWVSLPGPSGPYEQLTNPVATAMVTYLLYNGPMDGTSFKIMLDRESDRYQDALQEFIEGQKEIEEKRFEEALNGEKDYVKRKFEREHGHEPDLESDEWEEFCREQSWSTYRKGNLTWDYDDMFASVASNFQIDDLAYAGRWAGDPVQMVGDYAENDLYDASREMWVYEYEGDEFEAYATSSAPIIPESIERDDINHSIASRDVEPGDYCEVKHPELDERVYCHFVRVADNEWTNISSGVQKELTEFVGEDWTEEAAELGRINPSMVITI